jgi:predicted nucleic acid-binding Zn ribbon protein
VSRTKNPKKISALVGDMYQVLGLTEAYHQHRTLQIWNDVVGETISAATSIERFTNGELFIRVRNPAWRMELNFRKKDILNKLNAALSSPMVSDIIFK